ncbi:MAG: hypothetical protein M1501_02085 [Candidatus Omnitrophica bacterium]|nr:hypothetical protein [Candidatus Omnitrophota bacterium]
MGIEISSKNTIKPRNVLIVEDDDMLRRLLCMEFKRKGHNVLEYRDEAYASSGIERDKPPIDAAIVDLMNVGYGGNMGDVLDRYPEYRNVMIIYYSSLTDQQFNKKILNRPNTYYIHKVPGSIKQVVSKVTDE